MPQTYTQAYMRRPIPNIPGDWTYTTAWIPSQFAKVGKVLKIKKENGWKVIETYATYPESLIMKYKDDFKYHRQVTDV